MKRTASGVDEMPMANTWKRATVPSGVGRLALLFAPVVLGGCAAAGTPAAPPTPAAVVEVPRHETLRATLWVQTAAEYPALTLQAYRGAEAALSRALADTTWTAAPVEQTGGFGRLPPAVILDIDETVLDNAPYQARRIEANGEFTPESWNEWVGEATAEPIPGAAEFTRSAAGMGVAVFYISNRDAELEEATRRNLAAAGFPLGDGSEDRVLSRGERPDWGSDKTTRRAHVAARYRILLSVGDDLNDFVPARISRGEREAIIRRYAAWWGERFIVLPNPIYGSWESAILDWRTDLTPEERRTIQDRALDPARSRGPR
jgi:5'-nucleotidase (lipoprotein e(P4) family)